MELVIGYTSTHKRTAARHENWNNYLDVLILIPSFFSDDDEFFDLPSDLPSDGDLTPTNESINISTNNTSTNGLVEKALERLENELVELDPQEHQQRNLFQTVDELMEGQADQQKLAFELLKKQNTQNITLNPNYLWRMCKSMYLMAVVIGQEGKVLISVIFSLI